MFKGRHPTHLEGFRLLQRARWETGGLFYEEATAEDLGGLPGEVKCTKKKKWWRVGNDEDEEGEEERRERVQEEQGERRGRHWEAESNSCYWGGRIPKMLLEEKSNAALTSSYI